MDITDLFPFGTKDLVLSKALEMFKQDPQNPTIPPPAVYVLRAVHKEVDGVKQYYEKGRQKGEPVMLIEAIPFTEDIIKLNTDLYNDLVKTNETIIHQNTYIEKSNAEKAEITTAFINLKEQYKKLTT